MKRLFITGTDTDAGKTFVSALLVQGLQLCGDTAYALKPIASGCDVNGDNADIKHLLAASQLPLVEPNINWCKFALPIAPHLAAQRQGITLLGSEFRQFVEDPRRPVADWQLIEGAGGWLLPLSDSELLADTVSAAGWPVLLVVGVKLGCLNHALLTIRELQRQQVPVVGYVANILVDMPALTENLAELQRLLKIPCLGVVPFQPQFPESVSLQLAKQLQQLM